MKILAAIGLVGITLGSTYWDQQWFFFSILKVLLLLLSQNYLHEIDGFQSAVGVIQLPSVVLSESSPFEGSKWVVLTTHNEQNIKGTTISDILDTTNLGEGYTGNETRILRQLCKLLQGKLQTLIKK